MSLPVPRHPTDWALLRKLWPYLRPDAWRFAIAFIAAPGSALLVIAQPYLLKIAIDDYIRPKDVAGIEHVALLFLGAVVAAFLLEATYTLFISYAALRSIGRLRHDVYAHTLSLSQSFFDHRPTGQLLTRATSDVEALGETLTAGAMTIVLDVLLVVGILIAMLSLNVKMTLVMLLLGPPVAFLLDRIRRVLRRLYLEIRDSFSALTAFTAERLTGIEVVQLYSDETRALEAFGERVGRYRTATIRTNIWDALLYAIVDGLGSVSVALLLWYGSGQTLQGAVTAGMLVAFIDYTDKIFSPIREFSAKLAIIQRATTALEKIFGLLDHGEQITPGNQIAADGPGHLHVDDLYFAYGDGPDVLRGVSFDIAPGQVVALVGRTGSGKTTIGKLLTRAYDGYRGSILLDGTDLTDIAPGEVRRFIGVVHQDVQLFPGDVRFNLTLGAPVSGERLREVISLAHADEAVEDLGGLDGRVDQGGGNLSVGEAQLLSFARTMAYDPPVVILDEATASVDTLTEARIQAATQAVLHSKTVLVIAHRLSTVVHADRILVLEGGLIVERGTHGELMAADGRYAELFRQQFAEDSAPESPDPGSARSVLLP